MPLQTFPVSEFSGGYNTAIDEATLPPNMTASMSNVDITDTGVITKRGGYAVLTASALVAGSPIKALWRTYFKDTAPAWLVVTGTALVAVGAVSSSSSGRVEAETVYVAASSIGWSVYESVGDSGGAQLLASRAPLGGSTIDGHVAKLQIPVCTGFTVVGRVTQTGNVTASYSVDGGAWQSVTAVTATSAEGNAWSASVGGLSAATHTVRVKASATPGIEWLGIDYADFALSVTSTHRDSTLTGTTTNYAGVMLNNRFYYGSGYDPIRYWDGTTTGAVSASGTATGGFACELRRRIFVAASATDKALLTYSDVDSPADFTGGGQVRVAGKDSGGECTGLQVFADRIWYFSPSRVYTLDTYGDPTNWKSKQLPEVPGCIAPGTLAVGGGYITWLSGDGVYTHNGESLVRISDAIAPTVKALPSTATGAYYNRRYWLANGSTVYCYRFPRGEQPGAWVKFDYNVTITCLTTTRGDEAGLFAGTSYGRIIQLDTGTNDGGSDISWHYRTPPLLGKGVGRKHFRHLWLWARSPNAQALTVTPSTEDVSAPAQTVSIDADSDVKPVRLCISSRGYRLALAFSGQGSAQPLDIVGLAIDHTVPRLM